MPSDDEVSTRQIGFCVGKEKEYQIVYGINSSAQVDRLTGSVDQIRQALATILVYDPQIMIAVDLEEDKRMSADEILETFVCS